MEPIDIKTRTPKFNKRRFWGFTKDGRFLTLGRTRFIPEVAAFIRSLPWVNTEEISRRLNEGIDPNERVLPNGIHMLEIAWRAGDIAVFERLLAAGGDPSKPIRPDQPEPSIEDFIKGELKRDSDNIRFVVAMERAALRKRQPTNVRAARQRTL